MTEAEVRTLIDAKFDLLARRFRERARHHRRHDPVQFPAEAAMAQAFEALAAELEAARSEPDRGGADR